MAQSHYFAKPLHAGVLSALVLATAAWAMPALAQPATPARDGNRWDGIDHQPTRAAVAAEEHRAGIALTDEQKRQADAELQRLGHGVLRDAGASDAAP